MPSSCFFHDDSVQSVEAGVLSLSNGTDTRQYHVRWALQMASRIEFQGKMISLSSTTSLHVRNQASWRVRWPYQQLPSGQGPNGCRFLSETIEVDSSRTGSSGCARIARRFMYPRAGNAWERVGGVYARWRGGLMLGRRFVSASNPSVRYSLIKISWPTASLRHSSSEMTES